MVIGQQKTDVIKIHVSLEITCPKVITENSCDQIISKVCIFQLIWGIFAVKSRHISLMNTEKVAIPNVCQLGYKILLRKASLLKHTNVIMLQSLI